VPPFRIYYQRRADELLIVRVYHQKRRPIER
jgi:plasmid stabilization system protein ParE